ncbi:hypothetical protein K435DRAFT_960297 [Dendrothele bispora CBS 962.96]|uniref:Mid2 domain-containing protein n=1 Tax=Dendrothele bispora (strain CBS 962.96) TaxID=1314807 RepID=A0A4S8MUN8_DENBC|nr:hypothetical protein K435DRAFT_960297 [Dendrothele bispora CBS 962.96]
MKLSTSLLVLCYAFSVSILSAFAIPSPKGGGGGHSSSSGSRPSYGSSYRRPTVITHSGSKCYDENGQLIPCPANKKGAIIAGIVVGSVLGAALIGFLIYYFIKRRRNSNRNVGAKGLPAYQKLDDSKEPNDTTLPVIPPTLNFKTSENVIMPTPSLPGQYHLA